MNKIVDAAKEAAERVTSSCGCVFCDIGLIPNMDGWHKLNFGKGKMAKPPSEIKCTKPQSTPGA